MAMKASSSVPDLTSNDRMRESRALTIGTASDVEARSTVTTPCSTLYPAPMSSRMAVAFSMSAGSKVILSLQNLSLSIEGVPWATIDPWSMMTMSSAPEASSM